MARAHDQSSLDTARRVFQLLVTDPQPLSLDGAEFDGLPRRPIPLDELRDFLLSRHCTNQTRDEVWAYLVRRSRTERGTWTVVCVGMALPALVATARWLADRSRDDRADIQSAVLTGFLNAVATIDLDRPAIVVRLSWAARRAGHAALEHSLDAPRPVVLDTEERFLQPSPAGHTDLVLARAIGESILTPTEAELISATRLDGISVVAWATGHGRRVPAVYKARERAERRLGTWLREQIAASNTEDVVASAVLSAVSRVDAPAGLAAPAPSQAVSGRLRNGRSPVSCVESKAAPDSGLPNRGETTTGSPRTTPEPEVRRCA